MRITFWGTRGSLATPGPTTNHYGGNTSCVQVQCDDGTLIVLDCGTGARRLGLSLLRDGQKPSRGHLLLSHTHWDHIQGFPFFAPLFTPGNEWDVYGPGGTGQRLEQTLTGQMEYEYFPISLDQMGATLRFHDLDEGPLQIGGAKVTAQYLNHPALTLGYRIEAGGQTLVYVADHEPHSRHQPDAILGAQVAATGIGVTLAGPIHREDQRHIDFLTGADLIIHDAQYTAEEYTGKMGWGHTAAQTAVDFAAAAGAKQLALFHHDPDRDDAALSALEQSCRVRGGAASTIGHYLEVFAAAEGHTVELAERRAGGAATAPAVPELDGAAMAVALPRSRETVLIVDDEPQVVRLLMRALKSEPLRLLSASDGDAALVIARAEHPDLILLDWRMPGKNGLEVCRAIRADGDVRLNAVPVVLLTAVTGSEETDVAFAAGATDYLTKPFGMAHVRARVHEWLQRERSAADASANGAGAKA